MPIVFRAFLIACLGAGLSFGLGGPTAAPAKAQGFFESLFGGFAKPKPAPGPRDVAPRSRPRAKPAPFSGFPFAQQPQPSKSKPRKRAGSGGLRTVCVRVCDGYYFPISFRASSRRLRRDESVCRKRCPGQGRLFYMSNRSEIGKARDRSGKRYVDLKAAFAYRKKRVANCACRPAPWTLQEQMRHATYAIEEGKSGGIAASVVAGSYEDGETPDGGDMADRLTRVQVFIDVPPGTEGKPSVIAGKAPAVKRKARKQTVSRANDRRRKTSRRAARRPAKSRPQRRASVAKPKPSGFSLFGGGGNAKHVWPGDG